MRMGAAISTWRRPNYLQLCCQRPRNARQNLPARPTGLNVHTEICHHLVRYLCTCSLLILSLDPDNSIDTKKLFGHETAWSACPLASSSRLLLKLRKPKKWKETSDQSVKATLASLGAKLTPLPGSVVSMANKHFAGPHKSSMFAVYDLLQVSATYAWA